MILQATIGVQSMQILLKIKVLPQVEEMEMSRYVQSKNPLNLKYTQYRICFSE